MAGVVAMEHVMVVVVVVGTYEDCLLKRMCGTVFTCLYLGKHKFVFNTLITIGWPYSVSFFRRLNTPTATEGSFTFNSILKLMLTIQGG